MSFFQTHHNQKNGFTLVELLVVIAILSLLASSVLVSLRQIQQKARDANRLEDMNSLITALQFYYDAEGHFPCPYFAYTDSLGVLGERGYLSRILQDPLTGPYNYITLRSGPADLTCGDGFHLDVTFEQNTTICPFGKFSIWNDKHCHVMYPDAPPNPPCSDPYHISVWPPSCACNDYFDIPWASCTS